MKKNFFKKSFSVFLAVLMLMSSWVFVTGDYNKASCADECDHSEFEVVEELFLEGTCSSNALWYVITRCKGCKTEIKREYKVGEINPDNHVNIVKVDAKKVTCEADGWDAYEYCVSCSYTTFDENRYFSALDHNYQAYTTPATCSQAGEITYICENDATHKYTVAIPVKPHTDVNPENGVCDVCGMNICLHEETVLKDAQGQSCISEGYTGNLYCKVCNLLIESGDVLPVLDHSFGNSPVSVVSESCTRAYRVETYKCRNCPATKSKVVEVNQIPHDMFIVDTIEPDCENKGYQASFCTKCSTNIVVTELPALGHKDSDENDSCDRCRKPILAPGEVAPCDCLCHSDSAIKQFIYKILSFIWKLVGVGQVCRCGKVIHYTV